MRFPVPIPCLAGRLAPIALTVATALALPTSAVAQPTVHVAYIVPSNRTPQTNAVRNLQELMPTMQSWYAEQMDRYGFGRKTFRYETEADGVTPKIHVLRVAATDAQIRNTDSTLYLNNAVDAAESAGFLGAQPNRIVILVTETQTQQANGTFLGNISVGGGAGNVDGGGVALLSAESIPFVRPSLLNDNRSLSGVIFPELGPRPLVPGFEDYTFSGVASTWQGAYAHELGHAFGLDHDFRNDQNRHGNLMGNGFRGWRASFFPDAYLTDDIQLSYVAALKLNANRYLDPLRQYRPNSSPPRVTMQEVGMVNTTAGHLEIHFTATDADGFRSVVLEGPDGPVDEMPITGTNVSGANAHVCNDAATVIPCARLRLRGKLRAEFGIYSTRRRGAARAAAVCVSVPVDRRCGRQNNSRCLEYDGPR